MNMVAVALPGRDIRCSSKKCKIQIYVNTGDYVSEFFDIRHRVDLTERFCMTEQSKHLEHTLPNRLALVFRHVTESF